MFNRLRNKFMIINMSITSVIMTVVLAAIYLITFDNTMDVYRQRLSMGGFIRAGITWQVSNWPEDISTVRIGYYPEWHIHTSFAAPLELVIGTTGLTPFEFVEIMSFNIIVDERGGFVSTQPILDLPQEEYERVAALALGRRRDFSVINFWERDWMYTISPVSPLSLTTPIDPSGNIWAAYEMPGDSLYMISFVDVTDSRQMLFILLTTLIVVGAAMLVVILAISRFFANRAIEPIAEAWNKQKRFVADASHELKTPLTIINANMDVLGLDAGLEKEDQVWFDIIRQELGRMSNLVADLLYLAKAEDEKNSEPVPFDLSSVCNDAGAAMETLIYEKGVNFDQSICPDVYVKGNEEKIRQALMILLDNAVKYTDPQGDISFMLKKRKGEALLQVKNTGNISPEDLPRIFDRFYRVDPSRSKETGGSGLGLSIAKAAVERSGGILSAQSYGGETVFTISMKLN